MWLMLFLVCTVPSGLPLGELGILGGTLLTCPLKFLLFPLLVLFCAEVCDTG